MFIFLPEFFFTVAMEKKKILCSIVISCVLFQDVMPQEALDGHRKIVLDALNRIGYSTVPTDYTSMYQAFVLFAKQMDGQILACQKDVENCQKDVENCQKDVENCQKDVEIYKKDVEIYKNRSIDFERESLIFKSVLKVRSELLEDMETYFEMEHVFPDSKKMREDLGGKQPRAIKYTDLFTDDYAELLKTLQPWQDKHTLKWLHYLAYCDSETATLIREQLQKRKLNVFKFCLLVGDIFGRISPTIHVFLNTNKLKPEHVLQGLQLYGIECNATLDSVALMMALPKFTTIRKKTTAPSVQIAYKKSRKRG